MTFVISSPDLVHITNELVGAPDVSADRADIRPADPVRAANCDGEPADASGLFGQLGVFTVFVLCDRVQVPQQQAGERGDDDGSDGVDDN